MKWCLVNIDILYYKRKNNIFCDLLTFSVYTPCVLTPYESVEAHYLDWLYVNINKTEFLDTQFYILSLSLWFKAEIEKAKWGWGGEGGRGVKKKGICKVTKPALKVKGWVIMPVGRWHLWKLSLQRWSQRSSGWQVLYFIFEIRNFSISNWN